VVPRCLRQSAAGRARTHTRARAGDTFESFSNHWKVQDTMDTNTAEAAKRRWDWLPTAMPGVARLMREKRQRYGDAHVDECWRRSIAGEGGWLFAREGTLAVGTPFAGDPELANFAAMHVTDGQALLVIKEPSRGA